MRKHSFVRWLHAGTKKRSKRCPDLISDCDGHHGSLIGDLVPRRRCHDEALQRPGLALHVQLDLWAGETHAIDNPNPTPRKTRPSCFELHNGFVGRAGLVTTCLKIQPDNEFASHAFHDLTRGRTRCGPVPRRRRSVRRSRPGYSPTNTARGLFFSAAPSSSPS